MRRRGTGLMFLSLAGLLGAAALADTEVKLKGVHLCCGACVKAVGKALSGLDGVKAQCDRDAEEVTITATDAAGARKALDALAAAGFHGETGNAELSIKDDSGAPKGKVMSLKLSGVHNCCGQCTKDIKAVLGKVKGVQGDTVKAKAASFEVSGDFNARALIKALNAAGYHVKVVN